MARVGRKWGALIVDGQYLVGNPKEPCPLVTGELAPPYVVRVANAPLEGPLLHIEGEAEAVAHLVAERMIIARNGSVSERLWRLVTSGAEGAEIDARWLAEAPAHVWQIVRDAVLRCS